jgi:hypothetical protein
MPIAFADIALGTLTRVGLSDRYGAIATVLDSRSPCSLDQAIEAWERLRREIESWQAFVDIRFQQNTEDQRPKSECAQADELKPVVLEFNTELKRRLLAHEDRNRLQHLVGRHALQLWQADLATFAPVIAEDLQREAELCARYTEIVAAARLTIDGKTVNLSRWKSAESTWRRCADASSVFSVGS